MTPRINDGSRPSRLALGRDRSGELEISEEQRALASSNAWNASVDATGVPRFDPERLRSCAAGLADEAPAPKAEVVPLFSRWTPGILLAAAAAMFAIFVPNPPDESSPNRIKGEAELDFVILRDGQPEAGSASEPVHSGDMIQFTYRGTADQLILVGVDGLGDAIAYYPDEGDAPMSIVPGERHVLDGSILLDDAPGPEIFVAYFGDARVGDVKGLVRSEFASGGVAAIRTLDEERPDIAILVLDKE